MYIAGVSFCQWMTLTALAAISFIYLASLDIQVCLIFFIILIIKTICSHSSTHIFSFLHISEQGCRNDIKKITSIMQALDDQCIVPPPLDVSCDSVHCNALTQSSTVSYAFSCHNDVENETSSPELEVSKVQRRIWANAKDNNDINDINDDSERDGSRINEKKRKRDDDNDGEQGGSRINEMRKKEEEIAKLKRTINTLELKMKDMQSTSRATSRDKTGWKGEELIFVKDVNDFCRDRLYPKEKFLRKNWQEYLPYDTRSLYSVCMKYLSIPKGADKRDIWYRVIVASIRDK